MAVKSLNKNQSGFTIIEVIVVIAIFSLLMVGLLNVFDWHNKVYFLERADTQATGSARVAMNDMRKYIAQASAVAASQTVNSTTYTTDSQNLVLQLPSYDSSGNLLVNTYDYVIYYKSGTSLYQLISLGSGSARTGGTKLMSADVSSLSFTYDSGTMPAVSKVTVDLTTAAISRGSSTTTAHVAETIFLRNK